jgi:hypothetical protein
VVPGGDVVQSESDGDKNEQPVQGRFEPGTSHGETIGGSVRSYQL